jgi:TRAP-type transport system small permease protein
MLQLKRLTHGLSNVAAMAIAAMILLTIADVLMKSFFNRPIKGTFELVELLLVFVVFFGIAEVFRADGNICVDVVDHALGARGRAALQAFGALSSLAFLLLVGWAMIGSAWDTVDYPQWTQEIGIPLYAYWVPILIGTALSIVAAAAVGWMRLQLRAPKGET